MIQIFNFKIFILSNHQNHFQGILNDINIFINFLLKNRENFKMHSLFSCFNLCDLFHTSKPLSFMPNKKYVTSFKSKVHYDKDQ